jgi:hypothetical protein
MEVRTMFSAVAAVDGSGMVLSCEKIWNDTGLFDLGRVGLYGIEGKIKALQSRFYY